MHIDGLEAVQQSSFLSVTVLTGEDINGQFQLGIQHHQRLSRQGPGTHRSQLFDPMFGARKVVATENLHPKSR